MVSKLDEIRAAVAECSVVEDGATQEDRQRENARRIRVFGMLDNYAQELSAGTNSSSAASSAAGSNEDIEVTHPRQQQQPYRVPLKGSLLEEHMCSSVWCHWLYRASATTVVSWVVMRNNCSSRRHKATCASPRVVRC